MGDGLKFALALAVMSGTTYLIRLIPIIFIKQKIKSTFLRSFLYYAPYTVLSAIAFPSIFFVTGNIVSGIAAVAVCVFLAYRSKGLIVVGFGGVLAALIAEGILLLL